MSRVDVSPEQLNAEAAVRSTRVEQPLEELIEDHRLLYRADLALSRLHISSGETEAEERNRAKAKTNGHPATWTGMPFNPPFLRYINWSRDTFVMGVRPTHPGQTFPWATARFAQWAECRRFHPEHYGRTEWRGSLCYQLVSFTVTRKRDDGLPFSLEDACLVLGVTPPRAGRTLRNALLWIEAAMDRARHRQEEGNKPPRERLGTTIAGDHWWRESKEMQRHDQPGHAEDCPQCQNGAAMSEGLDIARQLARGARTPKELERALQAARDAAKADVERIRAALQDSGRHTESRLGSGSV